MVFKNVVSKLCYNMTPQDLNAAILLELSLYHPPRGGRQLRLWHIGLFHFIHSANPPHIQVQLPPDLKNTNAAQCETNKNIKPFILQQSANLYKLMRMHFLARGDHITETALFLHPYPDNRWRVCYPAMSASKAASQLDCVLIIFMLPLHAPLPLLFGPPTLVTLRLMMIEDMDTRMLP